MATHKYGPPLGPSRSIRQSDPVTPVRLSLPVGGDTVAVPATRAAQRGALSGSDKPPRPIFNGWGDSERETRDQEAARPRTTEKYSLIRPLSFREHSPFPGGLVPEKGPQEGPGTKAEGTGPKGLKPLAKTSQEPRNSFYPPRNAFYPFLENSSFLRKNVPFLRNENSRTPHQKHVNQKV